MLTAVKNQIKVSLLSIKYAIQRELLNKMTFIFDATFMVLNNASFLIQWLVLFSIKNSIGGYNFKEIALLWGISAGTYGVAHFFFKESFNLSETIANGGLDVYLLQPKNVLLSCLTASVEASALGDMVYAIIMLFIYGFSIKGLLLITLFSISGGLVLVSVAVIAASLSFWFGKVDLFADTINSIFTYFSTYPDGIFKGIIKILFYTIIPLEIATYIPVRVIINFNIMDFLIVIGITAFIVALAFLVFYRGLKRYCSSNLAVVRV